MLQPIIEQPAPLPFDSTDFTMNTIGNTTYSPIGLVQPQYTATNEWEEGYEDEDEYEEKEVIQEIDPDLEDEEGEAIENDEESNMEDNLDDDEFEQYLLGDEEE
jgi:hypothetical protein